MKELDILTRLLVLEGAAGVEPFTWAQRPRPATLQVAQARMEGTPCPVWFTPESTNMYGLLLGCARRALTKSRTRHLSGEDLLQNVLAGLNANGTIGVHKVHAAGVRAREGILGGSETPARLANGLLGKWVRLMALNVLKMRTADSIEGLKAPLNMLKAQPTEEVDWLGLLASCICGPGALPERLRGLMREAVMDRFSHPVRGALNRQIMAAWFDALVEGHLLTPSLEWAMAAGIPKPEDSRARAALNTRMWRAWKKATPVIKQTLEADPEVMSLVGMRHTYLADAYHQGCG